MAISLQFLIDKTRLDSGLGNNRFRSNSQIADLLTDAYSDLRDKMIMRFAYWFRKTYEFTLSNGEGNNGLDLSLVPDLEMVQGLDLLDSNGNPLTVEMLGSFAERNQFNAAYPFAGAWSFNGFVGRRYFLDGDRLFVYPSANAAGSYRLIYTPQGKRFQLPVDVEFDIASGDIGLVPPPGGLDGDGAWLLTNAFNGIDDLDTIPDDGGFDLILAFDSPNGAFSGTWNVVSVGKPPLFGSPTFGCQLASTAGYTSPAAGSGSYTFQPTGTISQLPVELTPWHKYLTLHASIAIRTSRQQQTAELDRQFALIQQRIVDVTKQRSQGIQQAPITRTNYGGRGFGSGFGY